MLLDFNYFILFFFNKIFKIYLLIIYFWLCWVFVSVRGLSLVAASGGHSSSWCAGLSLSWPLPLRSTGSRRAGSAIVAHGPSCSTACGIFPDQGLNPCPCIGRQILNHCATREAPTLIIYYILWSQSSFQMKAFSPSFYSNLMQNLTHSLNHHNSMIWVCLHLNNNSNNTRNRFLNCCDIACIILNLKKKFF